MVFDHRQNRRVADQGRAERAKRIAFATPAHQQLQRYCCIQQADRGFPAECETLREHVDGLRPLGKNLEHAQAHAGKQNLGIDKTRAQIKQGA